MIRLLLTTIILTMLAQPVWAVGWYTCTAHNYHSDVVNDFDAIQTFDNPVKFKLYYDEHHVRFTGDFHKVFGNHWGEYEISFLEHKGFVASRFLTAISFHQTWGLAVAQVGHLSTRIFRADCGYCFSCASD